LRISPVKRLKKLKFVFPVEIAVYIIIQACKDPHFEYSTTQFSNDNSTLMKYRTIKMKDIYLDMFGQVKVVTPRINQDFLYLIQKKYF
jgi:hypothetical protein